jgi:hypothetical protein
VALGALRRRGFIDDDSDAIGLRNPDGSAGAPQAGRVSKITFGR